MSAKDKNTCMVAWNPGVWPYTTRCVLTRGHEADHEDREGRTIPNLDKAQEALEEVRAEGIDHLYCGHCGGIKDVRSVDFGDADVAMVRHLCVDCRTAILEWI